jgi:hypothetical protein
MRTYDRITGKAMGSDPCILDSEPDPDGPVE